MSGCARRRSRSLTTIALLASGSFVIGALSVFRLDANKEATRPASGTGGFALLGTSALPIVHDLNTRSGRDFFGLNEDDLRGVYFVPFRVHEGDEASCLNLNRAQKPRLLGVKPNLLAGRFTFTATVKGWPRGKAWQRLSRSAAPSIPQNAEVAAVGDANSIRWALGRKLGDALDYTDERGRPFQVRLVGALANSVLQGSLIIDEADFIERFPTESGCRFFLIDAPVHEVPELSSVLSHALQDVGFEVAPAAQRLNAFNAVQNTYLGTFQILGGLGLLLGSAGLGVVVLRNVLERRAELGLLLAVGFRRRTLLWLLLGEHAALLAAGLGLGMLSAAVAVLPEILSSAAELPYRSLALTWLAVLINGGVWTWLATRHALGGRLLDSLRKE